MRRSDAIFILLLCLLFMEFNHLQAQTLQVSLSSDTKVNRTTKGGTATIFFDSSIEDLNIVCTEENPNESIIKINEHQWFVNIDVDKDIEADGVCYRNFLLKCPLSAEYYLTTSEIGYNQVLYYTVVLPNQFPTTLSAEYIFSKTAKHGVRLLFGKRIGCYMGYKWGYYKKHGSDISTITHDYDITRAEELGYIRMAITGGLRLGVMHKNKASLYVLIGGGYGEYGRQWENQLEVNNNNLFYSDYIKGFEGEIACQCILSDGIAVSLGTNMVIGNGKISVDYQIGLGLNFNIDKMFHSKNIIQ